MGMYCCCNCKIMKDWETRCTCDWEGWVNIDDWPPHRKNKSLPFCLPAEEGKYMTRYQNCAGDHYEIVQEYKKIPRKEECVFTGKEEFLHWSGNSEDQPYAWRNIRPEDE